MENNVKIRIKVGSMEFDYEGATSCLKDTLETSLSTVSQLSGHLSSAISSEVAPASEGKTSDVDSMTPVETDFQNIADLYDAIQPKTNGNKALVVAYWFHIYEGKTNFSSHSINQALEGLGYRISNIADAINKLKAKNPSLMVQTKKKGASKRARKECRITDAGVKAVKAMISRGDSDEKS
ncbi:MAG: hypothetical protein ACR2PR_01495 [Pseudohongiellaceae bacterium]